MATHLPGRSSRNRSVPEAWHAAPRGAGRSGLFVFTIEDAREIASELGAHDADSFAKGPFAKESASWVFLCRVHHAVRPINIGRNEAARHNSVLGIITRNPPRCTHVFIGCIAVAPSATYAASSSNSCADYIRAVTEASGPIAVARLSGQTGGRVLASFSSIMPALL
jgi:hypothetical protein